MCWNIKETSNCCANAPTEPRDSLCIEKHKGHPTNSHGIVIMSGLRQVGSLCHTCKGLPWPNSS
jgi:hypothetical protein